MFIFHIIVAGTIRRRIAFSSSQPLLQSIEAEREAMPVTEVEGRLSAIALLPARSAALYFYNSSNTNPI